jgi:hypothetical protein
MTMRFYRRFAAVGLMAALGFAAWAQAPVAPQPTLIDPAAKDYGTRPVAYIYGNVPVTRADLAEFLIARGGYEKVELVVNKMIIETEARKAVVTVTTQEMEKALADDLAGIGVNKNQFIEVVLSKYGKTYFEWMEDVVRPRLLLTKMIEKDNAVVVTDEDLRKEFDRLHGEKRRIQIIIWPKGDDIKEIMKLWEKIRKDPKEFDRVATQQANPSLASTAGHVTPIGRNLTAEEKIIEEKAFSLQPGDVSEILQTTQGTVVIKLHEIISPNAKVKFEDEKEKMRKGVYELKLSQAIPKYFEKLKTSAKPQLLMTGPPSQWNIAKSNRELAEDVMKGHQVQPASAPPKP